MSSSPTLIGRDRELAMLRRLVRDAAAGRGGCGLLLGEAGAGKTRLLRELAAESARAGLVVLRGAAPSVVASPPWGVISQALRSWTRAEPFPTEHLAPFALGLHQILPEWPPPPNPIQLSEDQMRMLILEGALRLVIHAARGRGAIVLLDDLQDADAESLAFVHHACASAQEPVALVCGVRTGEGRAVEHDLRAFERRGLARVIELAPLTPRDVSTLIGEIIGVDAPGALVADVVARTDGNPLLIEHAIQAYLSSRALEINEGVATWRGESSARFSRAGLEFVRHRLDLASDDARKVLIAAAITGRFDPWLLAATTETDERTIDETLRAALATGLIELSSPEPGFRHALVREAVASLVSRREVVGIHQRAADAIAEHGSEDPTWLEARAYHLEAAGQTQQAARQLVHAGRLALAAHAPLSAESLARRAISLDTEARIDARALLAEALGSLGRWEDALEIDRETGDENDPARLERMARNAVSAGRLEEAGALIARARAVGAPHARMLALSALSALWRGRLEEATSSARELLADAEQRGDAADMCAALDVIGRSADALGARDDARAAFRRWAEQAGAAGLTASRLQALMELGNLDFMSGGPAQGLQDARALALEAGAFTTIVLADLSLVWWLGHRGALTEAIDLGNEAIELCRRFELDLLPHALTATAWANEHAVIGSGKTLLEEATAIAPEDVDLLILHGWTRGDSALRAGRFAEAVEAYEPAMAMMREAPSAVPPPVPFMRVCALVATGRASEASEALEEARSSPALPRLYVNPMWLAVAEALVSGSEASLEKAVNTAADNGLFNRAVALMLGAVVIGGKESERWLRDALSVFDVSGAQTDASRARKLLRERDMRVPRRRRPSAAVPEELSRLGVTDTEFEVLRLLADGLSNAEIAERRFLSIRTVEDKVSALLQKLGASSRAALIARGLSAARTSGL